MSTPVSDFCLRFPDEASSFAVAQALDAVAITEDGPRLVRFTHRYAIDVIGEILISGEEDSSVVKLDGWHVNFRILDESELPAILAPYVILVKSPLRQWA